MLKIVDRRGNLVRIYRRPPPPQKKGKGWSKVGNDVHMDRDETGRDDTNRKGILREDEKEKEMNEKDEERRSACLTTEENLGIAKRKKGSWRTWREPPLALPPDPRNLKRKRVLNPINGGPPRKKKILCF